MIDLREFAFDAAFGRMAGLHLERPGRPKVIGLHGWLDNAASFIPLLEHLPELDLLLLDLPGHGHSDHLPAGTQYGLRITINAILDVVDGLGWESFGLLGHSMGAAIASIMAAALPQRVTRLAVIEALGPLSDDPDNATVRLRRWIEAERGLRRKSQRVFSDETVPVRVRMAVNRISKKNATLLVNRGIIPVEKGFIWRTDQRLTLPDMRRMTEAQALAWVAGIECPTKAVFAEPAQEYFPEAARRNRVEKLAHGKVFYMAGVHHLHMEEPEAVAKAIGDHFV